MDSIGIWSHLRDPIPEVRASLNIWCLRELDPDDITSALAIKPSVAYRDRAIGVRFDEQGKRLQPRRRTLWRLDSPQFFSVQVRPAVDWLIERLTGLSPTIAAWAESGRAKVDVFVAVHAADLVPELMFSPEQLLALGTLGASVWFDLSIGVPETLERRFTQHLDNEVWGEPHAEPEPD